MKYIRTENGIYEVKATLEHNKQVVEYDCSKIVDNKNGTSTIIPKHFKVCEVISQADTIEELCDEFVYCYRNDMPILVYEEQIKQLILLGRIQDVRGAIWTNWGLKYVAKMNEDGELVLI